jgi:hypothetical protein
MAFSLRRTHVDPYDTARQAAEYLGRRKRFGWYLVLSHGIALGNGNKKSAALPSGIFRRSLRSIDLGRLLRRDAQGILNP